MEKTTQASDQRHYNDENRPSVHYPRKLNNSPTLTFLKQ